MINKYYQTKTEMAAAISAACGGTVGTIKKTLSLMKVECIEICVQIDINEEAVDVRLTLYATPGRYLESKNQTT